MRINQKNEPIGLDALLGSRATGSHRLRRLTAFHPQPLREIFCKLIKLARPFGNLERRLHRVIAQIFADRVAR